MFACGSTTAWSGACNARMLHCMCMKMLHRGPKALAVDYFQKKKFFKDVWQGSKYTSGPLVWEAMLQQLISVQTVDLNEKTIKLKIET